MIPRPSKEVLAHSQSVKAVSTAIEVHHTSIVRAFQARSGHTMALAASNILLGACEKMKFDCETVVEFDRLLTLERGDDRTIADRRYAAAAKAYEAVVKTRETVRLLLGPNGVTELGVSGDTPRDPGALHNLGEIILTGLKRMKRQPSSIPGIAFDPGAIAEILSPSLQDLAAAIEESAQDLRENEAALLNRDNALRDSVRTFRVTAKMTSALLEYAGLDEMAARIAPSGRIPGTLAEEVEAVRAATASI